MPPRIRTRASKALKENIGSEQKIKNTKSNTKLPRKALADKTNSASDDTSVEVPKIEKAEARPRRDRRLPSRFVENPVLNNLSNNSKDNNIVTCGSNTIKSSKPAVTSKVDNTSAKSDEKDVSPFKTPSKAETSLVVSRPRRICRLPSRFEDHSISPNKYIPIQPANASTPKQDSKGKPSSNKVNADKDSKSSDQKHTLNVPPTRAARTAKTKPTENTAKDKSSPDSNNNAKAKSKKAQAVLTSPTKISPKLNTANVTNKFFNRTVSPQVSPTQKVNSKPTIGKKVTVNNSSFKVLGGKKRPQQTDYNDLDIYEFTFDPTEEPQPQKKKRKKPVTKKPAKVAKPKAVPTYRSAYDQNISKALSALKKVVKPSKPAEPVKLPQIQEISDEVINTAEANNVATSNDKLAINKENHVTMSNDTAKTSMHECNYPSIRVEDIAADIEPSVNHCDDINYSPVNSPRPDSPAPNRLLDPRQSPGRPVPNNDPLNLQEDLSFFDDVPVASSSMNMSVRHPLASPWRVEFGSLPIKWHSNTYVKPNMTPAVESSFICSEESNKKKHVYTNIVPEMNESLPQIVSDTPNLKQPSIISFIKEVAERQAKKKRGRSVSPSKATAIFDNINENSSNKQQTQKASSNNVPLSNNTSEEVSSSNDTSNNKENSKEERKTRKRKNDENICGKPAKSPRKQKDKDCTYFGFDDSENLDQENVSPTKAKANVRGMSLRARSRVVLKEINGPTRAALPVAAKSKTATSSEAINRVFEEMKSATDAPEFPEKYVEQNVTNIEDPTHDDSQSIHLFEDLELVHHLKPTRKSYGKAKKVTFRQPSLSDSDSQEVIANMRDTSFEDDLADLTFEVPNIKEKKKTKKKPKKLMSKKEAKEAEAWAAGFNSMCEEIEDFPLVLE